MYFVDRHKLETCLQYMEHLYSITGEFDDVPQDSFQKLAFERAIHMQIEALLDIGNLLIDGFIMRDPGSYEDIIMILEDENVIHAQDKEVLVPFILCRKELVSEYLNIDHSQLWTKWGQAKESLNQFPGKVRSYLDEQIGPVSAFTPKS